MVHQLFQKRVQHAISLCLACRILALFDSSDGVHKLIWPRDADNVKQTQSPYHSHNDIQEHNLCCTYEEQVQSEW